MEGLADARMRGLLTNLAPYDRCCSEFIRVSDSLLPRRVFRRLAPELLGDGKTTAGVPVAVQLLGADADLLAANAARLAEFKPATVDLNFGCPSPIVNRHGAGAVLLDNPEGLHGIALAVRNAVPPDIPVTAKMRLGTEDTSRTLACAEALAAAGVAELAVHARTRADGFRYPARWEWLGSIRETVAIPVIANGDIWTWEDYRRCRDISGCEDVMLGRGALADPWLAQRLRMGAGGEVDAGRGWMELVPYIQAFWLQVEQEVAPRHAAGVLKQWLALLARAYPEARALLAALRGLAKPEDIGRSLASDRLGNSRSAIAA